MSWGEREESGSVTFHLGDVISRNPRCPDLCVGTQNEHDGLEACLGTEQLLQSKRKCIVRPM